MSVRVWKAVRAVGVSILLLTAFFSAWVYASTYYIPKDHGYEQIQVGGMYAWRRNDYIFTFFDFVKSIESPHSNSGCNAVSPECEGGTIYGTYIPLDILCASVLVVGVSQAMLKRKAKK